MTAHAPSDFFFFFFLAMAPHFQISAIKLQQVQCYYFQWEVWPQTQVARHWDLGELETSYSKYFCLLLIID